MTKALFALLLLFTCIAAPAQKPHEKPSQSSEGNRPASDAHSFMELFTKLEDSVASAVQKKDRPALDKTLAPEFIIRSSDDPEHPVTRAQWLRKDLEEGNISSFHQRAFAIRAFASEAIVSYVQKQKATLGSANRSGNFFIVDVWVVNHGEWQLAARYLSRVERPSGSR
jgi:hypothetical protein